MADVDKIMKRYERQDADKELAERAFGLPDDPSGGLNKVYAASIAHNMPEDNQDIRELLERYSSGAKGRNGLPNGERELTRWNAQLAAEEVIKNWVSISEPALEKYMGDNMQTVWSRWAGDSDRIDLS